MKPLDDYFNDWEGLAFGFGYGTGEAYIIPALKNFMGSINVGHDGATTYDHEQLEVAVGAATAWLSINILCRVKIIEYGTSPRYGWLTKQGLSLKKFIDAKTADELYTMTCRDENYVHCYPAACNCGPDGYDEGRKCGNPFWRE